MKVDLATKDYVDNQRGSIDYLYFKSESELNDLLDKYYRKSIVVIPTNEVTLGGITIKAWTCIFVPFATAGDTFAIAVYPDASNFFIIGHTNLGWTVKKLI